MLYTQKKSITAPTVNALKDIICEINPVVIIQYSQNRINLFVKNIKK